MESKLFLTGPSGCGKSTMIYNALGDSLACAGGFITKREVDNDGSVLGFDLYPAAAAAGVAGFSGARFLDLSGSAAKADNEVFRVEAVRLLHEAEYYPFSVIDEIGGFELLIPQFRDALSIFLSSPSPCIGIIKGESNCRRVMDSLSLSSRFLSIREQIIYAMKSFDDIRIIETTGWNDESAIEAVNDWCRTYVL